MKNRLRKIRKHLKVSQFDMAKIMGLGASTWQNYELGTSVPNARVMMKLNEKGYDINWVLTGKGTMIQISFKDATDHFFWYKKLYNNVNITDQDRTENNGEMMYRKIANYISKFFKGE